MNTCKECKFWKPIEKKEWTSKEDEYSGHCSSAKFVYGEDIPTDGLKYWDYEDYSAGFATGRDFGCIHWSAK